MGASCDDSGRLKFDAVVREVLVGPLSEKTRSRHGILETVEAPPKQLTVPLPSEGTVYQYRFIKEVGRMMHFFYFWCNTGKCMTYYFMSRNPEKIILLFTNHKLRIEQKLNITLSQ